MFDISPAVVVGFLSIDLSSATTTSRGDEERLSLPYHGSLPVTTATASTSIPVT